MRRESASRRKPPASTEHLNRNINRSDATEGAAGEPSPARSETVAQKKETRPTAGFLSFEPLNRLELLTCALRMRCSKPVSYHCQTLLAEPCSHKFRQFSEAFTHFLLILAHPSSIFAAMITHYWQTLEDALKKAKQAGKQPGCEFWGITVSGKKGFAVYKNGTLVERYIKK